MPGIFCFGIVLNDHAVGVQQEQKSASRHCSQAGSVTPHCKAGMIALPVVDKDRRPNTTAIRGGHGVLLRQLLAEAAVPPLEQ
jgi:hypothetical protein